MEQIGNVFNYLKKAFCLNREHRQLFLPQVAFITLKTLWFVLSGSFLYQMVMATAKPGFSYQMLRQFLIHSFAFTAISIFIYLLLSILVEAGLYEMFNRCTTQGIIPNGTFINGVRKHALRFLAVDLLIILASILFIVPYVLVGLLTLAAGFVLIPFVAQIFTTMWKISMVMEHRSILDGLKRSFQFAKSHFLPLAFLVFLKEAFSSFPKGSNFRSNFGNWSNSSPSGSSNVDLSSSTNTPDVDFYETFLNNIPYIKIGFWVLIPVVSIAVLISSLIKMIFQIFFSLALFIMYQENSDSLCIESPKEVL